MRVEPDRVIRASELAQYGFCARAWWLGTVEGYPSSHREAMIAGEAAHRRHGLRVHGAAFLRRAGYALLVLAILMAVIGLVGPSL